MYCIYDIKYNITNTLNIKIIYNGTIMEQICDKYMIVLYYIIFYNIFKLYVCVYIYI